MLRHSRWLSTRRAHVQTWFFDIRGRLQRTSGNLGGGGFEISDIPGRGEGVVCESSDVRKFLKNRDSNMSERA